jgi:hypothetical protein
MALFEVAALNERFVEPEVRDRDRELDEHEDHREEPEVARREETGEGDPEGDSHSLRGELARDAPAERPDGSGSVVVAGAGPRASGVAHAP